MRSSSQFRVDPFQNCRFSLSPLMAELREGRVKTYNVKMVKPEMVGKVLNYIEIKKPFGSI